MVRRSPSFSLWIDFLTKMTYELRCVIQKVKTVLGKYKTIFLRRLFPGWRQADGGGHELAFWANWISTRVVSPDKDFQFRIDTNRPLQDNFVRLIPASRSQPKILDVGCGPLSTVGLRFPGGTVALTGADPLAGHYRELLLEHGALPNCELVACDGEALLEKFGPDSFDLVCSINALDHSRSPVKVFSNMAAVCRPGGYLYFSHFEDEGITERYTGMHQWNLALQKGRMMVNNGRMTFDFHPEQAGMETVSAKANPAENRIVLEWVLRKKVEA